MGMTIDEAIKELEYVKKQTGYADIALDLAIKALEQQPCEDCISREAVDNYIVKLMSGYLYDEERTRLEDLTAYIWELPSVTPNYNSIKTELEPSEDCISREAVKEMLTEEWTKYMPMELDINLSFVMEKINELPSITPQQTRWIPVSERLPELGERVLCQCQANIYEVLKLTVDGWYYNPNHCYMESFVIAWMPLPQPYKAESEE